MDPKQTLIDARHELGQGDPENCLILLTEYATWRKRGGFQPIGVFAPGDQGDSVARGLRQQCEAELQP